MPAIVIAGLVRSLKNISVHYRHFDVTVKVYVCANIKHTQTLCSKCPPCARMQARRRGRHCLTASLMNTWWKCSHSWSDATSAGQHHESGCGTHAPAAYPKCCSLPGWGLLADHRAGAMKSDVRARSHIDCVNTVSLPYDWLQYRM